MTPEEYAQAVKDRLEQADLVVYDGEPRVLVGEAQFPYVVCYFPAGGIYQDRYAGGQKALAWEFPAVCVGTLPESARFAAAAVRAGLAGWRPDPDPAASPLYEIAAGPVITDGPDEDRRSSITLTFRLHTRR